MGDDRSDEGRQLQALRLIRAFVRIADAAHRESVIELAERLADEAPSGTNGSVAPQTEGYPAGTPRDIPN